MYGRVSRGRQATAALLQVADDLHENSVVSDATWATLSRKYSTEQLMDAVFTVGQHNLVSWALNFLAFRSTTSRPEAGHRLAFADIRNSRSLFIRGETQRRYNCYARPSKTRTTFRHNGNNGCLDSRLKSMFCILNPRR
jgi:hypothetical protein